MAHSEIYGPQYKGGALLCWLVFNRWRAFDFHLCVNMTRDKPFMENDWMYNQQPLRQSFSLLFFFFNEILLVKKKNLFPFRGRRFQLAGCLHSHPSPKTGLILIQTQMYCLLLWGIMARDSKICLSCLKLLRTLRALLSKCWFDYQYFNLRKRNTVTAWKLSRLTGENLWWREP